MNWMIHSACVAYYLFSWSNTKSKDMQNISWMYLLSNTRYAIKLWSVRNRDESKRGIQHTDNTTELVGSDLLLCRTSRVVLTTMSRMYVAIEGSSQMSQIRIEDIDGIDKHVRSRHMPSTVLFLIHWTIFFVLPIKMGCKNFPYPFPQLKTQEYICFWHDINKNYAASTLHWCHWQHN